MGSERNRPQTEIRFPIEARKDKYGDTYYLGWTDAPAQLDLSDCAFFIFLGDDAEVCIRKRRDIRDNRNKRQRSKFYRDNGRGSREDHKHRDGDCQQGIVAEEQDDDYFAGDEHGDEELDR
jgi:hypothetical protein